MRTWEHIRNVIGNNWELDGNTQNLLKMQFRVNFQEGLLYHQETLNFEYPTHLANYYLATLTCGPLGEGKYVHHFNGGGGHLVLTALSTMGKYNISPSHVRKI
jgi:hypothetical protein